MSTRKFPYPVDFISSTLPRPQDRIPASVSAERQSVAPTKYGGPQVLPTSFLAWLLMRMKRPARNQDASENLSRPKDVLEETAGYLRISAHAAVATRNQVVENMGIAQTLCRLWQEGKRHIKNEGVTENVYENKRHRKMKSQNLRPTSGCL